MQKISHKIVKKQQKIGIKTYQHKKINIKNTIMKHRESNFKKLRQLRIEDGQNNLTNLFNLHLRFNTIVMHYLNHTNTLKNHNDTNGTQQN